MRNIKLARLRAALIEGERSGPSTAFDFDEFIARQLQAAKSGPMKKPASPSKPE